MTLTRKILLSAAGAIALGAGVLTGLLYFSTWAQDIVIVRTIDAAFSEQRDDLAAPGALRLMICGSGSPLSDRSRAPACQLVVAGGKIFVVDAGAGSWTNAARWRLPLKKVEAVLLTHYHSDHIGDLGEVNLQSWVSGRKGPLPVYGGPGIEKVVNGFNEAYEPDRKHRVDHHGADFLIPDAGLMTPRLIAAPDGGPLTAGWVRDPATLRATGEQVIYDQDGVRITAFAVDHAPVHPAYGYRFDYGGRSIVLSGDTSRSKSLELASAGADLLLHEAMDKPIVAQMEAASERFGRDRNAHIFHDIPDYHASPRDAEETAEAAGVRTLVLTHLIPPLPQWLADRVFRRGLAQDKVDTYVAYDGFYVELPAGSKDVRTGTLTP